MKIATRKATVEDIPAIAELFDLYRQFYAQPADLPLATRFIEARLTHGESVILVAEASAGELVGFCQLYPTFCSVEAQPIFVLYDLFVSPLTRRSGVGGMLLRAAEDVAMAEGKVRMDLTTARTNSRAQRLYEALGWRRDYVFHAYSRYVGR